LMSLISTKFHNHVFYINFVLTNSYSWFTKFDRKMICCTWCKYENMTSQYFFSLTIINPMLIKSTPKNNNK